jgi:hypothetical protein
MFMATCTPIKLKSRAMIFLACCAIIPALMLSACGTPTATPDPQAQIMAAVAATLAAIPAPTHSPTATTAPTPTQFAVKNIFCEYNFCIGHPQDFFLIDQGSTRQPPLASNYGNGILFGYSQTLFIEMAWTISGPTFDPQKTMHYILEEKEGLQGNMGALLIGKINVFYQPISTISSSLPYGGIAAWQCGDRDFTWKVYTPQDGMAAGLAKQALDQFRCQEQ